MVGANSQFIGHDPGQTASERSSNYPGPFDTWFENRRLGLLFEASVNGGKLLVCSMDLANDLDRRPAARQMRYSILQYMGGNSFSPKQTVEPETIQSLYKK